ncbi:MAG TPA: zinc ribbon domain-containing protein [Desulfobacterales bacterium]|nr:zinc ribbon domain-containing protein [Desulfobacterales bacterium]
MPIYEFKCLKCEEFIELLVMNKDEEIELKCPKCKCEDLERILSSTSYNMADGSGKSQGVKSQTRTCGSGSCTTYEIPGHTK